MASGGDFFIFGEGHGLTVSTIPDLKCKSSLCVSSVAVRLRNMQNKTRQAYEPLYKRLLVVKINHLY